MRFGLKHTLRCVIWVKLWKLEALIWAGSGVNAQNLNRVYCCSSCTTKTTNSNKKNDNYGPTQWQQQQQLKGKLTKGVLFLSSHRFQCSSPRIISRSSSSTSSPFFRFLFSFFSFGPTQVSLFFSVDIFKSIETLQPSLLTHILCYVMQVSNIKCNFLFDSCETYFGLITSCIRITVSIRLLQLLDQGVVSTHNLLYHFSFS